MKYILILVLLMPSCANKPTLEEKMDKKIDCLKRCYA